MTNLAGKWERPSYNNVIHMKDYGGGGGMGGGIEGRLDKLEDDVSTLKKDVHTLQLDVAVIKSNYATKADVAEAKASIIMWVVMAVFLAQLLPMLKDWVSSQHSAPQAPVTAPAKP